jgi:hypothetical protein
MDVDADDNLYVPNSASLDTANAWGFQIFKKATGIQTSTTVLTQYDVSAGDSGNQPMYAIAVPKKLENGKIVASKPDYESDLTNEMAEWVVVGGAKNDYSGVNLQAELRKVRLVTTAANANAPRATVNLQVAAGRLDKFVLGGAASSVDANAFDGSARSVFSSNLFQKLYYTDGIGDYKVYDPKADTLSTWKSTSAGEIPARARLIETWNGRIVLARFADDPQLWAMSAQDDPDDWDQFPPVVNAVQAIAGNNPEAGHRVPDIVNSIIPVSDDLLIMGGDRTIHRFSGDPMAGGQIDKVNAETGIAFGRPWARDDKGNIWFVGSRGGLWIMDPAGVTVREITDYSVSRELQAIDFTTFHIQMAYDYRHEGLWIAQCPFGSEAALQTHWFYDIKNGGLWPDSYAEQGMQPTALGVLDSDAVTDRVVVFGCGDGHIRKWHEDERSDEQTNGTKAAVSARVLLGPYKSPVPGRHLRVVDVSIALADDEAGATLNVYASNTSDTKGDPQHSCPLGPGRNDYIKCRAVGSHVWLEIVQGGVNQRFSYEEGSMRFTVAGRQRTLVL